MPPRCRRWPRRPRSGWATPSSPIRLDHRPGFFDRDVPQRHHFGIAALVVAAEIAVAQALADALRVVAQDLVEIDHGLLLRGRGYAFQPGPGKIFHPGSVGGDGVDLLHLVPGLRRVPPVVEF